MKILNFGSLNIDFVYEVDHFVRAGETTSSGKYSKFPGGKGLNQSVALGRYGSNIYHAGKIGSDGSFLLDTLNDAGVNTKFILQNGSSCGNATIQVDLSGQNGIIVYGGANREILEFEIDYILNNFSKGDFLVLQNEINNVDYIIDIAYDKGLQIVFNPSPIDNNILNLPYEKISYLILNEIEGQELTGKSNSKDILHKLNENSPACTIVLTLGDQGSICYDGLQYYENGIYNTKVVDTTAAGDTFTGYFIASMTDGENIKSALDIASKAAAIAVSRAGAATSIPTLAEVLDFKFL